MPKKLVVVLGATGLQGGSVVIALEARGGYAIRGITRDTFSASSKALASKGVQMVEANAMDKESLVREFTGAYAVFGITTPFQPVNETEQGKNIVDACKTNNVPLLVWSSLHSATKVSNGKYTKAVIWDEKAAVDDYIREVGQPAAIVIPGTFTENIQTFKMFNPNPDDPNKYILSSLGVRPMVPHAYTYVGADLGPCVAAAIGKWEDPTWKQRLSKGPISTCSYWTTGNEMVETLKRLTGKEVEYQIVGMPNEGLNQMMRIADEGLVFKGETFPTQLFVDMGVKFHTFEDYVQMELLPSLERKQDPAVNSG